MMLKWWLIAAVIVYGAFIALGYAAQRFLQYFPERRRTAPWAVGLTKARCRAPPLPLNFDLEITGFETAEIDALLTIQPRDPRKISLIEFLLSNEWPSAG
jgi:hypothetical protein